jgi:hypothetical protein
MKLAFYKEGLGFYRFVCLSPVGSKCYVQAVFDGHGGPTEGQVICCSSSSMNSGVWLKHPYSAAMQFPGVGDAVAIDQTPAKHGKTDVAGVALGRQVRQ